MSIMSAIMFDYNSLKAGLFSQITMSMASAKNLLNVISLWYFMTRLLFYHWNTIPHKVLCN